MKKYYPRISDAILQLHLKTMGGVLIQGPKWCGKTTSAEQYASSVIYLSNPEDATLASISPKSALTGATPHLVDEWQVCPQLWDMARFEIDHREGNGQFIFTGSATPADRSKIKHSGTGRFAWLTMRTMSLWESGDSSGEVSLGGLFDSTKNVYAKNNADIEQLAFLICRGGWPNIAGSTDSAALNVAMNYVDAVVETDIIQIDGINRNPDRVRKVMRSLARNQGTQCPISVIRKDIAENGNLEISDDTIASYLEALHNIFVTENAAAWNPNLRSKTAIRTSSTRYFTDPSIGAASLGIGPNDLIGDLKTLGLFFEGMCMRDLRVYAQALDGNVYHYRDKNGLECDAVVHLRNGKYGLIEIKLGGDQLIEEGAESLKALTRQIDTEKMNAPSFMMVLTGTGKYAYQRADGVVVVPVGTLRE